MSFIFSRTKDLEQKPEISHSLLWAFLFIGFIVSSKFTPSYAASPITYDGKSNITISGEEFTSGSSGVSILLKNCSNIKITDCRFILNSSIIGIQLQNCSNIEITNCYFEKFRSGIYAITCKGGINIQCNEFKDIAGIKPRGQMVQFNKCTGAGNRVNYNILEHTFGSGTPEDLINMYGSSGISSDPLQIIGNKTRGGGPSSSGGGIMVGDNDGHDIRVEDNILVDPGQYGIGCPAGYNITIKNNKVYGKQQSFTNVGLYVGLGSEIDAGFPCDGPTIRVEGNLINWKNKNGVQNDFYHCSCCPGVIKTNNTLNAPIGPDILPDVLTLDSENCGGTVTPPPPPPPPTYWPVPGKIEAEDYSSMSGIQTQAATDDGEGSNISHIESGDWAEYTISCESAGYYKMDLRVASGSEGGRIEIKNGDAVHGSVEVTSTSGYQTWTTVSTIIQLSSGEQSLRLAFSGSSSGLMNVNWIEFTNTSTTAFPLLPFTGIKKSLTLSQNKESNIIRFNIFLPGQESFSLNVFDICGRRIFSQHQSISPTGRHTVAWKRFKSANLTGTVIVKLSSGKENIVQKLNLWN